ncbi:unnamed protein product, partial [Ranitomeya imitator]
INSKLREDVKDLFDNTTSNMTNMFWNNVNMNMTAIFTAKFSYKANITIVFYLNDKLIADLMKTSSRRKRSSVNESESIYIDYVDDGDRLNVTELAKSAYCTFEGYKVDNTTLRCRSLCVNNTYCKNNAACQLVNGIISCR